MKKITKIRYSDSDHEITDVQFADGSCAKIQDAITQAERGEIEGVNVGAAPNGRKTLRGYPDGDPSNNLTNKPRF